MSNKLGVEHQAVQEKRGIFGGPSIWEQKRAQKFVAGPGELNDLGGIIRPGQKKEWVGFIG